MAAPMVYRIFRQSGRFTNKLVKSYQFTPTIKDIHVAKTLSNSSEFDPSILDTVVCPLAKTQLRYDEKASELVNDELGVAYKIIDGIPNLIPQDARMIKQDKDSPLKTSDVETTTEAP